MDRQELLKKTKKDLLLLAQQHELPGVSRMTKEKLVAALLAIEEQPKPQKAAAKRQPEPLPSAKTEQPLPVAAPKQSSYPDLEAPSAPVSELEMLFSGGGGFMFGELGKGRLEKPMEIQKPSDGPRDLPGDDVVPETYERDALFLMARDHQWLYSYWQLSPQLRSRIAKAGADSRLALRLFRLEKTERSLEKEAPIELSSHEYYFRVAGNGRVYELEMWLLRGSEAELLLSSRPAETHRITAGAYRSAHFVTIPVEVPMKDLINALRLFLDDPQQISQKIAELKLRGITLSYEILNLEGIDSQVRKRLAEHVFGYSKQPFSDEFMRQKKDSR